jgi:hypothetical protein
MLETTAAALEPLLADLVFVGGATLPFYTAESFDLNVRVTNDVDCIVPAATLHDFHRFEKKLRALGHAPCQEPGAPLCRYWVAGERVDFMPFAEAALGFSNRWYEPGLKAAIQRKLPSGRKLRLLPRAYFIAAKFEAHKSRGGNDIRLSQDLEDIFRALGFPTALPELSAAPPDLREYLVRELRASLKNPLFEESLVSALGNGQGQEAARLLESLKRWAG